MKLKASKYITRPWQSNVIFESLVVLFSILILLGWTFNIDILIHPVTGSYAMNPLTAICFIVLSIPLIVLKLFDEKKSLNILGISLTSVVLIVAIIVLCQILLDSGPRLETWLFHNKMIIEGDERLVNFMAPNTSICFILSAVAILMLNKKISNKWIPSEFLALFIGFVATTTLVGYLYDIKEFYGFFKYFPMAVYTAINFLLISAAILFANKNKGFIYDFLGANIGSSIARKLLPTAILLPIVLGFIRINLEQKGLLTGELGVGLLILFNMVIFILIIWIYALELNKKDVLRKSAENITIETSNRLQLATKSGNVGVWELDVANNKLIWDRQMCVLYGLKYETFDGDYETWRNTIHLDDAERTHKEILSSIYNGKAYSSEFRVVWPGSIIKTIKATAKIERDHEGKAVRFIGVNWDISELKNAEEVLRNTLNIVSNYKYAIDESAIVAFTNDKGIIDQANDNFCEISKYSREELIGQDHRILNSGFHAKEFISNLWNTISNGQIWKGDFKNKAKDGTFYWVNTTIVPFFDKKGKPNRFMVIKTDITEQKRLQEEVKLIHLTASKKAKDQIEELAAKEAHLNSIFTTVTDIIFSLDVDQDGICRFSSVNPTFLSKTGFTYNQVIGKTIHEVIPSESVTFLINKYEEIIHSKKIVQWEETIDFPKGQLIAAVSIAPIFDKTGNCTKLIGSIHDLTQRIKAENKLKRSEIRLRNLFENAPEGILVFDLNSRKIIRANKCAINLFKYPSEVLLTMSAEDLTPEFQPGGILSAKKIMADIEKVVNGEKVSQEWLYHDAYGNEILAELHLITLPDTDPPQIYANIIDITEKHKTREKLKETESTLNNFFENASGCLMVLDVATGKFIRSNTKATELFKYPSKVLAKMQPIDVSPKFQKDGSLSAEKIKEGVTKTLNGEIVNFEWLFRDANDKEFPCEVTLILLPDSDRPKIYASIFDITEKKDTREKLKQQFKDLEIVNHELEKTNKELDRFVYSASHDLRSPLKSLLGLSEIIIDDISPDNAAQLEQMEMMKSSILKLDNFIEDILEYSRNARSEVVNNAIDFTETVNDILKKLRFINGSANVKLNVTIDQNETFITDIGRVNVVLNNLISNAFKYRDKSKEESFITIDIECSKDQAVISIEDNGIGIASDKNEKIFEMFYRATTTSSGSGLGLYIVKETLEKLNGTITLESQLKEGTKFTITLPNHLLTRN